METKVLSILEKVACTIDPGFIDHCNCFGKNNDRLIIKSSRRKDCKQVLQVKIEDLNTDDLDLPKDSSSRNND